MPNFRYERLAQGALCFGLLAAIGCSGISDTEAIDKLIAIEKEGKKRLTALYADFSAADYPAWDQPGHEDLHFEESRLMAEASKIFDWAGKEAKAIRVSDDLKPLRDSLVSYLETVVRQTRRTSERGIAGNYGRANDTYRQGQEFNKVAREKFMEQLEVLMKKKPSLRLKLDEFKKELAVEWKPGANRKDYLPHRHEVDAEATK